VALGDQCSGNAAEARSYTLNMPTAGNLALLLTYRAHEKPSILRMRLNSGAWQTFPLPQTAPGTYQTLALGTFTLVAGANSVELASGDGFICFRQLCTENSAARIGVVEEVSTEIVTTAVYPNPNTGEFRASFYVEAGRRALLSITTLQGREVWQKEMIGNGNHEEEVNLNDQPSGTYLLLLRKESGPGQQTQETRKILIIK
jgi:hypothetical protein